METKTKPRINFGGLKKSAPKTTSNDYATIPDPTGELKALATSVVGHKPNADRFVAGKKQLAEAAADHALENNNGKIEPAKGYLIQTDVGVKDILALQTSKYRMLDDTSVLADINPKLPDLFQEMFEIKIDGNLIPYDKAQDFIDDLVALKDKHGLADESVTFKAKNKPIASFHEARHQLFSVEENKKLQTICPFVSTIRIK
jgi:hypothetical protein